MGVEATASSAAATFMTGFIPSCIRELRDANDSSAGSVARGGHAFHVPPLSLLLSISQEA
jgi:hypothetical protein